MACTYGMSEKLGALTFGKKHTSLFLGTEYGEEKNYSEQTARQIDAEVKAVIDKSYQRVRSLLQENRSTLDALAGRLEEKETLSGEEVKSIVKNLILKKDEVVRNSSTEEQFYPEFNNKGR